MLRPLWWLEPLNNSISECGSAFLLGSEVYVQPVTESMLGPQGPHSDEATESVECALKNAEKAKESNATMPLRLPAYAGSESVW